MSPMTKTTDSENCRIYLNDQSSDLESLKPITCRGIDRSGQTEEHGGVLLSEHLTDVYINERLTMKLVCIPEYLPELVIGRLLTEGIIQTIDDIKSVYICEHGTRAKVYLSDTLSFVRNRTVPPTSGTDNGSLDSSDAKPADASDFFVERTPTCCTGNHVLNGDFLSCPTLGPVRPIPWKTSWIFSLADRFAEGMPLHKQTWCTHSCFLAWEDRLLFQCEDIGRHNALDKAIGHALLHGIDLSRCIVYSSGRIPTDMAEKAIRAGIPILSSKASPTREAVELAEHWGLTLVCNARRDSMRLYTGEPPM